MKIVTSSVFTRKTAMPNGGHVFQQTRPTFELNQHIIKTNILTNFQLHRDIIGTNLLTKFHEDRTKNVASRVLTRKTALPTGSHHIIKTNILTNFELDRDIIGTKLLTKFHADRKRNVPSRVFTNKSIRKTAPSPRQPFLTKFHEDWTKNINATPTGGHVFSPIWTIFELTNFHDDWAKTVTSRVFTRKTAPPTASHIFQRT
ncbi:hypothetical protein DPMN_150587 [Dreissena polymorpha]|uniref:Uncharacterized protein n=1 Tax=Dreissena polymorpha TaxID=45954 RepID=A0A9D4FFM5_DREPO|nr:hypothetical protein DPMN_150587 [Dreissena polymorpha]